MVWILICTVHCKFIWSFLAFPRTCNGQVIWLTLSLPKLIISNFPCSFTRHIHYNRLYEELILTNLYCTFELFKGWVNVLFELWSEMVNAQYIVQCADSVWWQKIWISFPAQDFSHSGATGGILYPKPEKGDPAETLHSWGISGWGILESSFVHGTVQCKPSL